jgi:hypothetical protein
MTPDWTLELAASADVYLVEEAIRGGRWDQHLDTLRTAVEERRATLTRQDPQ